MCDGSDRDQELLEKLSRQLSELTSASNTNIEEVLVPNLGNPWAQSSALPSEEHPSSFSPLYTWNPAFLPPTSGGSSPHLAGPNFHPQQNLPLASSGSIPPTNHNLSRNSWNQDHLLSSNRDFQVIGDLSGRFSNPKSSIPSQPDYNLGTSHHFHQPEPHFQASNTPIVGRGFAPAPPQPKEELFSNLASVLGNTSPSLNNHHQIFDFNSAPVNSHLNSGEGIEGFYNSNNSSELSSPGPLFDPSTPPPPFPFQRQLSETTEQPTSHSLSAPNEFLDYLRLQSKPLDLDLGTDIGGSEDWQTYSGQNKDVSDSEDGKQLYAEALSKWNSFDFAGIDSSHIGENFTSPQSSNTESTSDSTVQDSAKPSYSDIAKTPKVTPPVTSKVEQSGSEGASKSPILSKGGKPYRSLIQRSYSASKCWPKGNVDSVIDQPKVPPTSRYGLDSFEDNIYPHASAGKNCDNLSNISKTKRSGSSGGALDDLSLTMTGEKIINDGRDVPVQDAKNVDKPEQKTKTGVTQSKMSTSSSVKTPTAASSASKPEEKLFFDPKRIFQPKNTNKSRTQTATQTIPGKAIVNEKSDGETVLNNGKPTSSSSSFKLPTAARQHDYINNDLRDSNKVTNKTAAESIHPSAYGKNEEFHSKQKESMRSASGKRSSSGRANGSHHREKRKTTEDDPTDEYSQAPNAHRFLPANLDMERLEEWFCLTWVKISLWSSVVLTNTLNLIIYTFGLLFNISFGAYRLTCFLVVKCWTVLMTKIYARLGKNREDSSSWKSKDSVRRRIGLEENITLPSTGEEAMKRLLAGRGKDPYSILGVRQDSSDEDIKKYYRKQAVLVHPDKNQEPGAEEAFKILGHAFEKIGEPGKRKEYDEQALVESASELRKEFADLISKLQTKIQEAANLMPCDNCGNKHRRVPVDRPFYSARFCQKCNIRHPAKEGDVWAESTMLGFYWNYYALMDGSVYDITEWMRCHHEFYRRMRANEHTVLTRIATDSTKKSKHHHSRDANLEEFFNRIFPKTPGGGAPGQTNGAQPHSRAEPGWGQASHSSTGASSAAAAAAAAKKGGGRRKKKRH